MRVNGFSQHKGVYISNEVMIFLLFHQTNEVYEVTVTLVTVTFWLTLLPPFVHLH